MRDLLIDREAEVDTRRKAVAGLESEARAALERVSGIDAKAAKEELLRTVEDEAKRQAAVVVRDIEIKSREEADRRGRRILATAIQRLAAEVVTEASVSVVPLPSDEMKGRIIGRDGRNIRTFEAVTGVNLVVDDTPESVSVSTFDPVRREIARIALERLIEDGRIHPASIEEAYEKAKAEVEQSMVDAGEWALLEVGVSRIHPELVGLLGRLRFRTSYGQNVLNHLVESAHIAEMLAAELGVDPAEAKRAAFLHDIGKAVSHEVAGSHALIGAEIARRFGEDAAIVHGIEAHHNEVEPRTLTAILVQAADTVSAARPGARREALEGYVRRLEKLERIASDFTGVDRVYAMQAGREVRVVVDPGTVDDLSANQLATADRPPARGGTAVSRPDRGHRDPGVPGHGLRPLSTAGADAGDDTGETVTVGHARGAPQPGSHPVQGQGYFIRTFGCQMNEHDSERIAGLLEADGMVPVDRPERADVVVLNTCTIRENADERLRGYLGALRAIKSDRAVMQIAVGGCMAQKDGDTIRARAGWVDVVFGTHNTHRVVDLLDHAAEWGPVTEILDEATVGRRSAFDARRRTARSPHTAWVTITIGCNNSCTFCIVPAVRGREISRRPGDVIGEVAPTRRVGSHRGHPARPERQLVRSRPGAQRATPPLFADLLRQVGAVDGIRRVRYTSPHPKDFRQDVAAAMAETPAVCEHLHLPLQSGSDRVLAAMHRGYTGARFLDKLAMAHRTIPDLTVTTDIIVGFPGETEADFAATLDVVAAARFDSAFTFQFSPRPGTPAATMGDQVSKQVIQERFDRLVALQNEISLERNRRLLGRRLEVMVEGPSRKDPRWPPPGPEADCRSTSRSAPRPAPTSRSRSTRAAPHHLHGSLRP